MRDWKAEQRLTHRSFRIVDLVSDDDIITGRTFEDCTIYGPAVLTLLNDVTMDSNTFEGSRDALFWELPEERERVIGAIGLRDCRFRRCVFRRIGIAGKRGLIELFTRTMPADADRDEAEASTEP